MSRRDPSYILGINAYDHDVSACLLRDGEILVAISKERLTRVKHASGFYQEVVDYCLESAGITLEQVDLIVRNCYVLPVPELERRLAHRHHKFHLPVPEREAANRSPLFLTEAANVVTCSHHLAHAYSAFAVSPFDEGAVMVVDGVGSYREDVLEDVPESDEAHSLAREAESYYRFQGGQLEVIRKVFMGPSRGIFSDDFSALPGLGALYSRVATYVFGFWNRCGEVMGLAPYGRLTGDPLAVFREGDLEVPAWGSERRSPYLGRRDDQWVSSPHRREWEDLSRRVQEDLERVVVERARWLHDRTGARNLCIAGGVGLNCVANSVIQASTPFEKIFIQPAAGDDGVAIGCAYYGHLALRQRRRTFVMRSASLGRTYGATEIAEAFRPLSARVGTTRHRAPNVAESTARMLARGSVVGWFQGGSEFGPRSLGNRSILADPRDPAMKDRVNARVKHRQGFRPFAPVVIAERTGEIFEEDAESPFMLLVKRVRPEMLDKVPAIVHVDGTARVQTLRREENPRLYDVLEEFDRRTGVPVLLNTSFNVRHEPIVETPLDAMECFLGTRIDVLILDDWIVGKRHLHRALFPLFRLLVGYRQKLRSRSLVERIAENLLEG